MASRLAASVVRATTASVALAALDARRRQLSSPLSNHAIACEVLALQPYAAPGAAPASGVSNSGFSEKLSSAKRRPSKAVLTDEYEVVSRIGQGTYGEVFSVRHRRTGTLRAVKRGSARDARVAKSFPQEVEALAGLNHPHIVGLVEFLAEGEHLYIVEEFCAGCDLLDYLNKSPLNRDGVPHLPESSAVAIFRQCIKAVVGCHARGLAHRDVKLDNFVIAQDGTVKLIDFGAAQLVGGKETTLVASADYLAPESAPKSKPSAAVDVWSLGIVFFAMLTGESFLPSDVSSIAQARECLRDPTYVQQRLRATPGALAISEPALDLLQQMLRHDPSERITASEALSHPFVADGGRAE